jgi:hypothetical protein
MEASWTNSFQVFHVCAAVNRQNHAFVRRCIRTSRGYKPHRVGVLLARCDLLSRLHGLGMAYVRALAKAASCKVLGRISKCKPLLSQAAID